MSINLTRRGFLKSVACVLLLPKALLSQDGVRRFSIPVLLYRDLSYETKDDHTIAPGLFAAQIEWLWQRGYKAVSFRDIEIAKSLDNAVILTFDGGYTSFINYAFPVLQAYGYKATINIFGQHVNSFMKDATVKPMLSWDEYRYLAASGLVSLGCHTERIYNSQRQGRAGDSEETLLHKLKGFQERIAREMGTTSDIIAWHYGFSQEKSVSLAHRAGFRYILTTDAGLFQSQGGSTGIPRTTINERTRLSDFHSIVGAK